jgi:ADP-heptose:LPS heptosyltransferase
LTLATGAAVRARSAAAREGAGFPNHPRPPDDQPPPHTVDRTLALARLLGVDARSEDFRLEVPDEGRAYAEQFAAEQGGAYVVLAPAARWQSKLYPTRHWRVVAESLARRVPVVLVAGPGEEHLTRPLAGKNILDLGGQTNIPQMVGLLAAAKGLISGDSATMHIAAALGTPQLALMGPTDPARTGPYGRGRECMLITDLPCAACLRRRCGHVACMETMAPADVLAAAGRLFGV